MLLDHFNWLMKNDLAIDHNILILKIILTNSFNNGTAISKNFVLPLIEVFPVILILDLNYSEFCIAPTVSSLTYCHKLPDIFE